MVFTCTVSKTIGAYVISGSVRRVLPIIVANAHAATPTQAKMGYAYEIVFSLSALNRQFISRYPSVSRSIRPRA